MPDKKDEIPELFGELTIAEGKKWTVVYTKSRREKKLAEYALKNNIEYYLPFVDSVKHYKRKKLVYKKPVFSSYVFVRVTPDQKHDIIISGHMLQFLNISDELQFLNELRQIHKVRKAGMEITNHQYLTEGTRVRFTNGSLKGVEGLVTSVKNIQKVVLQVNILKRAIAVTADSSILEILPDEEDDEELEI